MDVCSGTEAARGAAAGGLIFISAGSGVGGAGSSGVGSLFGSEAASGRGAGDWIGSAVVCDVGGVLSGGLSVGTRLMSRTPPERVSTRSVSASSMAWLTLLGVGAAASAVGSLATVLSGADVTAWSMTWLTLGGVGVTAGTVGSMAVVTTVGSGAGSTASGVVCREADLALKKMSGQRIAVKWWA
jgi:hypothetical protein